MKCLCDSQNIHSMGKRDHINVFKCIDCKSIWIEPYNYHIEFYQGQHYNEFQVQKNMLSYHDRFQHDYNVAENRFHLLYPLIRKNWSILDIGCGNGAFVKFCLDFGYSATGIDLMDPIIEGVICGNFMETDFQRQFDIVTLFDTLEHFPEQNQVIQKICSISKNIIFIDQPDPETADNINWKHIRPLEHGFLTSEIFLSQRIKNYGFHLLIHTSQIPDKMSLIFSR